MRYSFYVFINQLSESICDLVNYIKNSDDPISHLGMLIDCNEAIDKITNVLVKEENCKNTGIEILDKEKSMIAKIADEFDTGVDIIPDLEELLKLSIEFKEFARNKIYVKYKIVFFAELGAKWDSMSSVYEAFNNREDCDVEVVIAPIFRAIKDKKDKIISDVIYNDFLTPLGIKHTPYQNYDIKKDLPDIVFSSQPYESVTSEQFWAENIAKYTRLVYLPYATFKSMPEKEVYVQSQMPIHKLAWRVIDQSEKAKEVHSKYSPVGGKNIIATGLPKWDYVVNLRNRSIKMPNEWKNKLEGKKVFLLNVHYLAKFPEEIFNQLDVIFYLGKFKDAGVILRLHPMLETIFKVYFRENLDKWEKIKEKIRSLPYAVIDDYTDYSYSFVFSDALITGYSSIISQYLIMDKPILLLYHDKEVQKRIDSPDYVFERYSLLDFPIEGNYDWFINNVINQIDEGKCNRHKLIEESLNNLDGKIGERLANLLINDMKKEDLPNESK